MKIGKFITATVIILAGVLVAASVSLAGTDMTKTFSSDDDFSNWTLTNIEAVGSDAGIRLRQIKVNHYAPSGEATYRFSPGGAASWRRASFVSEGTGLDVQFSINNSDFSGINADGSFSPAITLSDALYIRVRMTGGATTPILKSLAVEYEIDSRVKVILEKRIYRCIPGSGAGSCVNANAQGQALEETTFEPGDFAAVSIKVNSAVPGEQVEFNLRDYLPAEAVSPVEVTAVDDRYKYCHLSTADEAITGATIGEGKLTYENQTARDTDRYVCYRFGIGATEGNTNKNILSQTNAIAYRAGAGYEKIIGASNYYLLVKGFPANLTEPFRIPTIEDELGFAITKIIFSGPDQIASSSPSYIYSRGAGQKSRGGTLVSLPVKMTDLTAQNTFFEDNFYLLYNPIFYLFGNMFSGSSAASTAFDFGQGSSSISSGESGSEKLNSAASFYNYYFDEKSVLFWDKSNQDKNVAMEKNIGRIIGREGIRPDNLCVVANPGQFAGGQVYLDNPDCNINRKDNSNLWPSGRVWYLKATADVKISSKIAKGGTLVVDFAGASGTPTVKISTDQADFDGGSFLGLIVINGGQVEFTQEAEYFRGIVFTPNKITFSADGKPLTVWGSLIADQIDFNQREKNDQRFAVSVYTDRVLLNSGIPGFEKLMEIAVGQ